MANPTNVAGDLNVAQNANVARDLEVEGAMNVVGDSTMAGSASIAGEMSSGTASIGNGATGVFLSRENLTITVVNGIITGIA
jgi:hypothetical protein